MSLPITIEQAADNLNRSHSIDPEVPAGATCSRGVVNKAGIIVIDGEAANPFANFSTAQLQSILASLLSAGATDSVTGLKYSLSISGGQLTLTQL